MRARIKLRFGAGLIIICAVTACGPTKNNTGVSSDEGIVRIGDTAAANVNGSTIYASDIDRAAISQGLVQAGETLTSQDPSYPGILDELIDQRLLAMRAEDKALHQTPEAARRLAVARERILGNIIVEDHLAQTVTDANARKLYDAQMKLRQSGEEVRASHILVETEKEAMAVASRLDKGEAFAKVAFDVSIDQGTRAEGGDLGYFQADAMTAPFSKTVFALKKDEISPPFETQFGWHIAKLVDRRAAAKPSYEQKRAEIINYMTYDEIKKLLDSLRDDAQVKILTEGVEDIHAIEEGVEPDSSELPVKNPE